MKQPPARQDRDDGLRVLDRRRAIDDEFVVKVEEWMDRPQGRIRADVVQDKLVGMGVTGSPSSPGGTDARRGGTSAQ